MTSGSPETEPAAAQKIRLLLVEDDADDVLLISETLAASDVAFELIAVPRVREALNRLDEQPIDVVITDLTLPDCHGIETFRRLYAHRSRAPILVLSGLDDEALALETVKEGAQDYLAKGQLDQAVLVRAIRYALNRAEAERKLEEERNLLRSVIDNLPDSIYVKDEQGRYMLDNAAHRRQLGAASFDDVVGRTVADFFPAEVARAFQADDERVMRTGHPIINLHERVDVGPGPRRWLSTTKVPLRDSQGRIVGIIGIGRDITARKNSEERLAQYTEELREKNAEMEDDLNMAREVQQAFLPQQFPTFPSKAPVEESWVRFYSKYLPTTTLGGDFFHVLPISDTRAGVFICDVMGHGVRAALVTAIQRALVEELAPAANDPGQFLTQINQSLLSILRRTRSPMFASAFYLMIDIAEKTLRYANAGHPRPLHLHRDANTVTVLCGDGDRPGPALGVFDESRYRTYGCPIAPHDMVMLFTDGLYEVEGAHGELYDQELLLHAIERRVRQPAEAIFDETLEEVRGFSTSGGFIDDVCLVGVEFSGSRIPQGISVPEPSSER